MFKNKLRQNNGVIEMDIIIAMIIVVIFITMISMITINVYSSLVSTQKAAVCTDYAVKIFENAELLPYDDERLKAGTYTKDYGQADNEILGIIIDTNYKVELNITDYNKIPGNEDKQDLIKKLDLRVYYKENNLEKNIDIQTLKINK
ncbi:MAG: hypothetical protein FWF46_06200 [Oscillospiraceae bacterium]|nr:hypothetical protein [Oscillospiraceae bacterium]